MFPVVYFVPVTLPNSNYFYLVLSRFHRIWQSKCGSRAHILDSKLLFNCFCFFSKADYKCVYIYIHRSVAIPAD
jgi:hypothetical protein